MSGDPDSGGSQRSAFAAFLSRQPSGMNSLDIRADVVFGNFVTGPVYLSLYFRTQTRSFATSLDAPVATVKRATLRRPMATLFPRSLPERVSNGKHA